MSLNLPFTDKKRIVIIGAGFGGLSLARKINKKKYQVVLIDKNNYHQFQPLFYQVATAGLEPSAVSFPLRKVFEADKDIFIRIADVISMDEREKSIETSIGKIQYDFLVLAMGTTNNFFGNKNIEAFSIPMKSVTEAIALRNTLLENFEKSVLADSDDERDGLLNLVVVGGGPTGTEIAGTLAEMRHYILPKDYPQMNFDRMKIYLIEGLPTVLNGMAEVSQRAALNYLKELGIELVLSTFVKDYDGRQVTLSNGNIIRTDNLIWAAGVIGNTIKGLPAAAIDKGNRIMVDEYLRVIGSENIFVAGDMAMMKDATYTKGHPQLAAVASQQGSLLAKNFNKMAAKKLPLKFVYFNKGSMATVGRNKAVVDLPFMHFQGFFAWLTWMFVHLILSLGVKNKIFIIINWFWNYVTYNPSLRLIIKPFQREPKPELK